MSIQNILRPVESLFGYFSSLSFTYRSLLLAFMQEGVIMPKIQIKRPIQIDWTPALFLSLTPVAAIVTTAWYLLTQSFHWGALALFAVFYTLTAMSITGGYHRYFAHRSYEATWIVKIFYALFGAAAFQNSILKWCTDHRIHHVCVDGERDPYSISKGFWYAHILWMFLKEESHPKFSSFQKDLLKDKIVLWQDKYYLAIAVTTGLLLPALLGWLFFGSFLGGLAFGGFLRMVAVHHGTFLINSLSHWWGKQTYTDSNSARDNIFTAFLTFGEGYHNFHHFFASDYRNGVRWYHWDPTKWLIYFKSTLGLVYNLKRTPDVNILRARINMKAKKFVKKTSQERFEKIQISFNDLKDKMIEGQKRIQALREDYQKSKLQKLEGYKGHLENLKREIQRLKKEKQNSYRELKNLLRENMTTRLIPQV